MKKLSFNYKGKFMNYSARRKFGSKEKDSGWCIKDVDTIKVSLFGQGGGKKAMLFDILPKGSKVPIWYKVWFL